MQTTRQKNAPKIGRCVCCTLEGTWLWRMYYTRPLARTFAYHWYCTECIARNAFWRDANQLLSFKTTNLPSRAGG